MTIFELVLAVTGALALGYGLSGLLRKRVEVYTKGEIRLYEAQSAQLMGMAFLLAGLGAFALGYFGISTLTMIFGILCTGAYFGLRSAANRRWINARGADFSVPSQRDQQ